MEGWRTEQEKIHQGGTKWRKSRKLCAFHGFFKSAPRLENVWFMVRLWKTFHFRINLGGKVFKMPDDHLEKRISFGHVW